jgi:hypothetical protein
MPQAKTRAAWWFPIPHYDLELTTSVPEMFASGTF